MLVPAQAYLGKHGGVTAEGMVGRGNIYLLEKAGFDNIVLSLKAKRCAPDRGGLSHRIFAYPQHLGVTEAGADQGHGKIGHWHRRLAAGRWKYHPSVPAGSPPRKWQLRSVFCALNCAAVFS